MHEVGKLIDNYDRKYSQLYNNFCACYKASLKGYSGLQIFTQNTSVKFHKRNFNFQSQDFCSKETSKANVVVTLSFSVSEDMIQIRSSKMYLVNC